MKKIIVLLSVLIIAVNVSVCAADGKITLVCEFPNSETGGKVTNIFEINYDTSTIIEDEVMTFTKAGRHKDNLTYRVMEITNENIEFETEASDYDTVLMTYRINRITGAYYIQNLNNPAHKGECRKSEGPKF